MGDPRGYQKELVPRGEKLDEYEEMNTPLVSIVTPTYNQVAFLRETIESVLMQDYPAIDYRVINDGSTDGTETVLEQYTDRMFWESRANRGQTAAINAGWQKAKGEILTWLNSDDTFLPGAVSTVVEYLQDHPDVDIIYGDTAFTDSLGKRIRGSPQRGPFDYKEFVRSCENPIPQPSAFVRRRVLQGVGLLDPSFYYFMDWDYWLRAGLKHRIVHIPVALSTYRLHAGSKTISGLARAAPELRYMYGKFFGDSTLPLEIRSLESEAMGNMYLTSAGYFLRGHVWRASAVNVLRAVRVDPGLVFTANGIHKVAYCLFGHLGVYRAMAKVLRSVLDRIRRWSTRVADLR